MVLNKFRQGKAGQADEAAQTLAAKAALITHTNNFGRVTWLGRPVWQNIADIWTLQETICEDQVDFVIECGTNHGGSAFFMATLFNLMGTGHVVTIDIEDLVNFTHPRITFLRGSSTDPDTIAKIPALMELYGAKRPMVFLDSDHAAPHVLNELRAYADFVPVGGYVAVQDGIIDELEMFAPSRPGPLVATRQFLAEDDRFEVDLERSSRFLYNHSPEGWLQRRK